MSYRINGFEQIRRENFGLYLKKLRKRRNLKQKDIAKEFGVNLYAIEKGTRVAPDNLLIKLAKKYEIPLEDIMERKHWPQLLLLSCIMRPTEVAIDILKDFEPELDPEEIKEIAEEIKRYTAFLLLSRQTSKHFATS